MTWDRVPLGQLGKWTGGGTPSKGRADFWEGTIPWLSPKDMGRDRLEDTRDHISATAVSESSTKLIPAGSVAVVTRSGILEHTLPSAFIPFDVTLNQDMKAITPKVGVDSAWVLWGLRAFERQILDTCRKAGTTVASIEWKRFSQFELPLPPLAEQRQVVELVEEHLSHLDAADASMVAGGARLAGVWHARAAGLLSDCAGEFVRLEDLLSEPLRNGRSDRASVDGTGVRCLTLTAITRREFIDRWTKVTVTPQAAAAALWLKCGDIFVQRSNTPELVGTSALYEGPPGWSIFPDLLIRVRVDPNLIDRHFLASVLRTDQVHRRLRAAAKGLAGSMPKIDQAAVADLLIPCPGLDVQRAIADDLQLLDQRIMQLRESVERQHLRSQALRRAVLAAAFSGRLTGHASDAEIIEETAEALPAQEALL